jgi:hypothetical protein
MEVESCDFKPGRERGTTCKWMVRFALHKLSTARCLALFVRRKPIAKDLAEPEKGAVLTAVKAHLARGFPEDRGRRFHAGFSQHWRASGILRVRGDFFVGQFEHGNAVVCQLGHEDRPGQSSEMGSGPSREAPHLV